MAETNKDVVVKMYDAINAHDIAAMGAVVDDGFVDHEPMGSDPTKAGTMAFFEAVLVAFPDFKMETTHMVAEGDLVSIFVTVTGTQRGEFMGIPASNKAVSVGVADLMRLKDGKVVEHWGLTDMLSMMQQLGVAP